MTTTNRNTAQSRAPIAAIVAAFLLTALPTVSIADGWELHTTSDAVPGTKEVESGKIAKAIRISEVHLSHASPENKVAVLTNLCIGYILSNDFGQAEKYCDQAVSRSNENTVSYSNRGVLNALQGDFSAAMQDFESAVNSDCLGECSVATNVPADLPRPTARRNLERMESRILAAKDSEDSGQKTAQAD